MSLWSSVSFNFAILINLLVAFFYPFGSNTGVGMLQCLITLDFVKQNSVSCMNLW